MIERGNRVKINPVDDACDMRIIGNFKGIPIKTKLTKKIDYYKAAKKAYCMSGDQFDCRDCDMCDYFEKHHYDGMACKTKLIVELVKIIDAYKKYDIFLASHGMFKEETKNDT